MEMAKLLVYAVYLYVLAGLVFAVLFLRRGIAVLDDAAKGISAKTSALLFPGIVAFWPVLLQKWLRLARKSVLAEGEEDQHLFKPANDSEQDSAIQP